VGVVSLVRVVNGELKSGDKIRVVSTGRSHTVDRLGRFTPKPIVARALACGDVGFVVAGIKEIDGAPVGDTITLENRPAAAPLPGFKQIKPRVFAGLFPSTPRTTRTSGTRSRNCASTTRRCTTSRRSRPPWGSVSAAGFSGCCTWTSCRSGSSASMRSSS